MTEHPLMKFMINLFAPVQFKKPLGVPTLPTECMYQIFQHLVDQGEALHPFLLINRYWCRNVIPFLWARPFEQLNPENMYKIMLVYLSSLNDAEKADLRDLLVQNSYDSEFITELMQQNNPLFNYPMMLQELSIKNLEMIVRSWIHRCNMEFGRQIDQIDQMDVQINSMTSILCKLFLRNSVNLRCFRVDKFSSHEDIPELSTLLEISPSLGFIGLSNISKLEINYSTQSILKNSLDLLKTIPSLCKRIHTMNIKLPIFESSNPDIIKVIISIIIAQDKLKEFSLEGVENENDSRDIIQALQSHVRSLSSVEIDSVNISTSSLYVLAKCSNLESLAITNCRGLTIQDMSNTVTTTPSTIDALWNNIKFVNLKKLYIKNLSKNTLISSLIIRAAGKSTLQELTLDVITQDTINSIIENCPNITHLSLVNYHPSLHDHLLNSLFQTLKNVTHLTIQIPSKSSSSISVSSSSIISGKSLPSSLTYLKLQCGFKKIQLDGLLSDCCNAKLKVLIIDVVKILYMDMKVITSFIKGQTGSSVKFLGIGGGIGCGKVTKELEELKENFGVCVIPWYEIANW
ncbi:642_t:CDS:1 [Scutellospora calospora]|uniref:642_t:CDS:1 n=1 Tax=Scutellospora calospora TaxID=85575 RepID=A0ACA9K308_9GLOM|nr:642_t:CDS:1 [Scutellospora calospora]